MALRRAGQLGLPLAWFVAVGRGVYHAQYPVCVVADDRSGCRWRWRWLSTRHSGGSPRGGRTGPAALRRAAQPAAATPAGVPGADAVGLRHDLRDVPAAACRAARRGTHPRRHPPAGTAVVPNGLALCSIHHRAFDRNVLGIRPDLVIDVRRDVLEEIDGPMLRHGLQEMRGVRIRVPRAVAAS